MASIVDYSGGVVFLIDEPEEVEILAVEEAGELSVIEIEGSGVTSTTELNLLQSYLSLDGGRPGSSYGDIEPLDGGNPDGYTSSV